ncbi:glycosyltransferase family 2 protein [Jhaorihella thermophila]|uniref:Glycosyltransferase 2-like domain-containing protein n=1 Tax=Jhaorihella thermophila TaxID=488547 RepID=A0A1H5TGB5_9RHOB|nr:glycosyltransferase family 2 protein [Jhaorihella thermophila]SEF61238.1 hypothetical protein SAMN05421751_102234 [Jhaorihella thermophila]
MTDPAILTIIVNWRTPGMTLKAAELALRAMKGLRGGIVIVDNNSGDGSFEHLSRAVAERGWDAEARVRVVQSGRNGGFGAGVNFGIRTGLASGEEPDFYYLLNSDAFPERDAIRVLCDFLLATPEAGFAGSFVRGADGEPHRTAFRFPSIASEFENGAMTGAISRMLERSVVAMPIPQGRGRVDWTAGASLMIRREVLDQVGTFDEAYFLYFEETDLCLRAARAGWSCYYVPESRVVHVGSVSTGLKSAERTPQYWFDSRLYYFIKNHGRLYATAATLAWIAGAGIWTVNRTLTRKPDRHRKGHMADLVSHALRQVIGRRGDGRGPARGALVEDRK